MEAQRNCLSGITHDMLSTYRDSLFDSPQVRALRDHIPFCSICQTQLAAFDAISDVLKRQRERDFGNHFWRDVLLRIQQKEKNVMTASRRSALGRVGFFLGIVLVVALFGVVLTQHVQFPTKGRSIATALPSPSATPGPVNLATLPLASSVWGSQAITTSVTLPSAFRVQGISVDGAKLFGYQTTSDGKTYQAGWYSLDTHTVTIINTAPVNPPVYDQHVNLPPQCCLSDGRYIVGADNVSLNNVYYYTLWSYDTQTGTERTLPADPNFNTLLWVVNGVADFIRLSNASPATYQLIRIDLATMHSSIAQHQPPRIDNFSPGNYPFVFYQIPANNQVHVYNTLTGEDTDITRYGDGIGGGALTSGDEFYTSLDPQAPQTILFFKEADNIIADSGQSSILAYLPLGDGGAMDANTRVVTLSLNIACSASTAGCQYNVIWDRALHKLLLGASYVVQGYTRTELLLNGHFLVVTDFTNKVTVYDTTQLPGA